RVLEAQGKSRPDARLRQYGRPASLPAATWRGRGGAPDRGARRSLGRGLDRTGFVGPFAPDDLRRLDLVAVHGPFFVDHVGVNVVGAVVQDQPLAAFGQP